MGNVNFSADMVGIQTLAQQGKTISQNGEAALMGSFEDLMLQLLANNIEMPANTQVASKENTEEQDVVVDAVLSGLANPEMPMQFVAENNIVTIDSADIMPVINVEMPMVATQEYIVAVADNEAASSVPQLQVETILSQTTEFSGLVQEAVTEVATEVADDVAQTVDTPEAVVNQPNVEMEQPEDGVVKPEAMQFGEEQPKDNEFTDKQEAFISTEDMLMMRAGNKIDFSAKNAVFKVAESPVNMQSPTAAADLADKILMRFSETEFEVELYPKNLGKITVNLSLEDGIVHVALSASNDKVNEFLASQSANIQGIVEKNTQYQAVIKVDDSQEQYEQQQRDNAQHGATEDEKERQQEHLQNLYRQNVPHTEDFLSMLKLV